jgi:hypothetical protein
MHQSIHLQHGSKSILALSFDHSIVHETKQYFNNLFMHSFISIELFRQDMHSFLSSIYYSVLYLRIFSIDPNRFYSSESCHSVWSSTDSATSHSPSTSCPHRSLKWPKHEIFVAGIFTQIRPAWVGDLGTRPKNSKSFRLRPYINLFIGDF